MADNTFVTRMVFEAAGIEQITASMKKLGATQEQINAAVTEYQNNLRKAAADAVKASESETAAVKKHTDALKERKVTQEAVNNAVKAGQNLVQEPSIVQSLYRDPNTRGIMNVQSQLAIAQSTLSKATGDDVVAAQARVDDLNKRYGTFITTMNQVAGVSRDTFTRNLSGDQIAAIVNNQDKLNATLGKTGTHLNETSNKARFSTNQMLQYSAAVRNTAESLASGMSPATVAMTQGMQVLGAYVGENMGLMLKLGVAAAVATPIMFTFARAMSLISQEREIDATARAYGNLIVGVSGAAATMRELADNSKFSRSEMVGAIQELSKLRNASSDVRGNVMTTVVPFAAATGKSPADAVKELVVAFNGTYESVRKLDQSYGFLSASQLEQIRIMMKQGDVLGANRLAMEAFSKQMEDAAKTGETTWSSLWQAVARNVNQNLDSIASHPVMKWMIGGMGDIVSVDNSIDSKLKKAKDRLDLLQNIGAAPWVVRDAEQDVEKIQRGRSRQSGSATAAEEAMNTQRIQNEGKLSKLLTDQNNEYSNQIDIIRAIGIERVKQEALQRGRKAARTAGITDAGQIESFATEFAGRDVSVATAQVEFDRQTESLRRQTQAERELAAATFLGANAMMQARAAAAAREAKATGMNETVARETSLARDQQQAYGAIGSELYKLTSAEKFLSDARTKGIDQATIEQRLRESGLIGTGMETRARDALTTAVAKQAAEQDRLNKITNDAARTRMGLYGSANDNLSSTERTYREAEIAANAQYGEQGASPDERKLKQAMEAARIARDQARAEQSKSIREQMNPELVYKQQLAEIDANADISEADRAAKRQEYANQYRDNLIARKELETDWASGADRAWMKYVRSVGTAADMSERFFMDSMKTMEDGMVEFAMTGEISFDKMFNSIIAGLIRMQIQMSFIKPIEAMGGLGGILGGLGGLFGGGDTGGGQGMASTSDTLAMYGENAHGNAFGSDGNVIPFAKGGIVNGLTPFRFGQGGALSGIMGEAGPEAIVPLTRTPQGDLGIRSTGGGMGVKVEVYDQRSGNAAPIDVETQMGAFGPIVRIIARDEARKAVAGYSQGGGLKNQLRNDYNLREPAVARG